MDGSGTRRSSAGGKCGVDVMVGLGPSNWRLRQVAGNMRGHLRHLVGSYEVRQGLVVRGGGFKKYMETHEDYPETPRSQKGRGMWRRKGEMSVGCPTCQ